MNPAPSFPVRIWHAVAGVGRVLWMVFVSVADEKLAAWNTRRRRAKLDKERE